VNIGILGAGQLGRMLALAGYPLGLSFRFYDEVPDAPAGQLAPLVVGKFDDHAALDRFADGLDVITYEFENVPVAAVRHLAQRIAVYPPAAALDIAQDRVSEKKCFQSLGIQTAKFAAIDSEEDLKAAENSVGFPAVLKTRRMGYDGKGQAVVKSHTEATSAMHQMGGKGLILESFVNFEREFSIIAVRSTTGQTAVYPAVENVHSGGILRQSIAPAPGVSKEHVAAACKHAEAVIKSLNYVGVLAIEFFCKKDGVAANEMAPRVHNSGHWTIEGSRTSQFENHLRAILGWPLGSTEMRSGQAGMINVIGGVPDADAVLRLGAHLHMYGKRPRAGRKLGHATIVGNAIEESVRQLRAVIERTNC